MPLHEKSEDSYAEESDYDEALTPRVQDRIHNAEKRQENQLDAIHDGVVQLKQQAIATNNEVVEQNFLIDNINVQIGEAEESVQTQTRAARKVTRQHRQLCGYYVVIILLVIALVVVAIV